MCLPVSAMASGLDEKVLFDGGPDQGGAAPPASSTVTTLFTSHKQAGQTPRFEAALCHCYGREAQTNSHIQNDMINQLGARETGNEHRQVAVFGLGPHASWISCGFLPNPSRKLALRGQCDQNKQEPGPVL